jgi:mono/diheme cytochrome c family protein
LRNEALGIGDWALVKYMTTTKTTLTLMLALAGAASLAGVLGGCRGDRGEKPPRQFFPDMDDHPKWKPQAGSGFYADGRTMRKPVQGTVAFGRDGWSARPTDTEINPMAGDRAGFLKEGGPEWTGMQGEEYLQTIPVTVDEKLVREGQKNFNIYCSVCHGYTGDGKGLAGQYFTVTPGNLQDPKYKAGGEEPLNRDGYMFTVIRNGVRSMPSYAHAISEHEAWAVVAYIRALQASQEGTLADVQDPAKRAELETKMNEADPAPAAPTTPAAPAPAQPATNGGAK